ncbi:MAG: cyclase family protein [Anaerolineae bacterium]|nr:cyclase family protein [Anaerolineae bacterium]
MPTIIDLSFPIRNSPAGTPPFQRIGIEYADHSQGTEEAERLTGVPRRLMRNGEAWAVETITNLGTHSSTHLDAPLHYNAEIQGKPAQSIDELPLEWFFARGVKLDFRHKADGDAITTTEIQAELQRIGHTLQARDIVLMWTGRDELFGRPDYWLHGPGVSAEATHWMFEQGVRVMGIDAWGWDRPLPTQAADAIAQDKLGVFWAAHQANLPYSQIERLCNLGAIPASGFMVACFPLKIERGSAAPARVVAILNN